MLYAGDLTGNRRINNTFHRDLRDAFTNKKGRARGARAEYNRTLRNERKADIERQRLWRMLNNAATRQGLNTNLKTEYGANGTWRFKSEASESELNNTYRAAQRKLYRESRKSQGLSQG